MAEEIPEFVEKTMPIYKFRCASCGHLRKGGTGKTSLVASFAAWA